MAAALAAASALALRSATPPPLTPRKRIEQALNRLTWGPAPGQIEAVEKIGLKNWLNQQLHPDAIPEDPELTTLLAPLDSLRMTPAESLAAYPPGELIQQMASGRRPLPGDPRLRAVVESEIAVLRQRQAARGESSDPAGRGGRGRGQRAADAGEPVVWGAPPLASFLSADQIHNLESGPLPDRVATLENLPEATRDQVLQSLPRSAARQLAPWAPIGQSRAIAYYLTPQQVTRMDLLGSKVLRAVYTNRQLEDVLTDFWFNHFNVDINKGQDHYLVAAYERDAIRPHVLDKFSNLLLATAQSPAMLFYLDNWQSVGDDAGARLAAQRQRRQQRAAARGLVLPPPAAAPQGLPHGLNENYGREIMELHTLGLHYTQQDVIAVARCFTGWTIQTPLQNPVFRYNDAMHDKGEKVVLGVTIPAGGGMDDGLKVIQILARNPDTAHHISYELAQRFLADDPPPALVDRMAKTFLSTDGDLRRVMETLITAPEFDDPAYFRAQVKSPLQVVVSSVRALGAGVSNPMWLVQQIAAMGEPLYASQPPTGYDNAGASWVSSGDLVTRMNFALRLAANRAPGIQVDLSPFLAPGANLETAENRVAQVLLQAPLSASTGAAIAKSFAPADAPAAASPGDPISPAQVTRLVALVLGSPDFQVH